MHIFASEIWSVFRDNGFGILLTSSLLSMYLENKDFQPYIRFCVVCKIILQWQLSVLKVEQVNRLQILLYSAAFNFAQMTLKKDMNPFTRPQPNNVE